MCLRLTIESSFVCTLYVHMSRTDLPSLSVKLEINQRMVAEFMTAYALHNRIQAINKQLRTFFHNLFVRKFSVFMFIVFVQSKEGRTRGKSNTTLVPS